MLVTVPLLLLLLDYWPLRRFERPNSSAAKLILEKIPLLVLSSFVAIATLVAQKSTIGYGGQTPLVSRLGNAAMACITYVCQMFWPRRLAVFYPQPVDGVPGAEIILCLALLGLVTAIAWWLRKTRPYLIVGWLWYLICLAPTLGFIPVGLQAHADRYTYLPQIGLYLSLTWLVADLVARNATAKRICALGSPAVILLLASLARAQTSSWRNTETLWQHAAAVTENNDVAHYNLALLAQDRGRIDEAIRHYESALASSGDRETSFHISAALLHNGLGIALAGKGRDEEAIAQYRRAISLRDGFADAHTNLATLLIKRGAVAEAIEHYRKALSIPPEDAGLHVRLAKALQRAGQTAEGRNEYRRALELTKDPDLSLKLKKAIDEAPVADDARR
jgi:tetratricopeptide (TPR) repeat protein